MRRDRTLYLLLALLIGLSAAGLGILRAGETAALTPDYRPERYALRPAVFTPVIDAGHGGEDGGAVAPNGRSEAAYNLEISLKTDVLLRFLGLSPCMTRTQDISLHDEDADSLREKKISDLTHRVELVNGWENAVLLSIHQNMFPNARYSGTQVFSRDDEASRSLAAYVQSAIRQGLQPDNTRENKVLSVKLLDDTVCPAILVECGFLSNAQEEARLRDEDYQRKLSMVLSIAMIEWVMQAEN